jgi:hypothetical protein
MNDNEIPADAEKHGRLIVGQCASKKEFAWGAGTISR